jgi:ligand-binding SRPBCC domain-containing protein
MPVIELTTRIAAPPERVFDLSRSIDAHLESAAETQERVVAGVSCGLIGPGEEVVWEALHFGVRQRLSVAITGFERPFWFQDTMTQGAFRRMRHDHEFHPEDGGTRMEDRFDFQSPFGPIGALVDRFVLTGYLRKFLERRNACIKALAESDGWRKFVAVTSVHTGSPETPGPDGASPASSGSP